MFKVVPCLRLEPEGLGVMECLLRLLHLSANVVSPGKMQSQAHVLGFNALGIAEILLGLARPASLDQGNGPGIDQSNGVPRFFDRPIYQIESLLAVPWIAKRQFPGEGIHASTSSGSLAKTWRRRLSDSS